MYILTKIYRATSKFAATVYYYTTKYLFLQYFFYKTIKLFWGISKNLLYLCLRDNLLKGHGQYIKRIFFYRLNMQPR